MNDFIKSSLFDMLDIDSSVLSTEADDTKYTKKVSIPQYLPSKVKPNIKSLFNDEKFNLLREDIFKCDEITDNEKQFLLSAATRHIVFNYSLIADYYAHSNKSMQDLMEKSALVIIDFNDAIANGYVELSSDLDAIEEEDCND